MASTINKHHYKHHIEYFFVKTASYFVNLLPPRVALCLGFAIAFCLFHIFCFRRTKAVKRIESVVGDRYTPRERTKIAWISLRNNCFNIIEMMRFKKLTLNQLQHQPLYGVGERTRKFYEQHGAFVLAVPHTGNWELGSALLAMCGLPCVVIVKRQKNLLVDALINRLRGSFGIEVIYNDSGAMKHVLRSIRQGKVLLILPDSHSRTESPKVDFLGGRANLGIGAAYFARAAHCPICPIVLTRQGWSCHEYKIFDPIYPDSNLDRNVDMQRMMQTLMSIFDHEIRESPEQYLWYNKRWVLDPPWDMAYLAQLKSKL